MKASIFLILVVFSATVSADTYGRGAGRSPCTGCSGCTGCGWGGCSGCSGCSSCSTSHCHSHEDVNGLLCYPKCRAGYKPFGCCICTGTPPPPPTHKPTQFPTFLPTASPTVSPTASPTDSPTASPTDSPTASPTRAPTASPTDSPTASPTDFPTTSPTDSPTASPTKLPTPAPTNTPTTASPTSSPTLAHADYCSNAKSFPQCRSKAFRYVCKWKRRQCIAKDVKIAPNNDVEYCGGIKLARVCRRDRKCWFKDNRCMPTWYAQDIACSRNRVGWRCKSTRCAWNMSAKVCHAKPRCSRALRNPFLCSKLVECSYDASTGCVAAVSN